MSEAAVNHLVLNYQGFRGKFHIVEVRRNGATVDECTVAKQIQNRIGYRWGVVADIDPSQPFRHAQVTDAEVQHLFDQAADLEVAGDTKYPRGKDGTWYSLRIGKINNQRIFSWWSNRQRELQNLYALENDIGRTVLRLLKRANS